MKKIASIILFYCAIVSTAAQAQKISVAITDINISSGLSPQEAVILSDKLINSFVISDKFNVIERNKRDEILKEQGFQQTGACYA
jgi:curli biogenesis system outer membrane secretion channel CsgG